MYLNKKQRGGGGEGVERVTDSLVSIQRYTGDVNEKTKHVIETCSLKGGI